MKRPILAAAVFGMGAMLTQPAIASDRYPEKPITVVVPVAAGGTVDRIARIIGEGLSDKFGQPVIVENRAGAAGTIGTRHVASAAPDGHTLLAIANTFASVPEFIPDAGYDPLRDFTPVTQTCSIPMVLVTHANTKYKTIGELVEDARANPEAITLGSSGQGSTGYIAAELFSRAAGVKMLNVYYKGNSQALLDVMGGQITGMFDQVSTAAGNVKSGKINALAVTTLTRSRSLPDVPTLDESGFKGFQDETFNALMAPANTPPEIIAKLHAAVAEIMNAPKTRQLLAEQGIEAKVSDTPEAFGTYLADSIERYRQIAQSASRQ